MSIELSVLEDIKSKIHTIRGKQVMLDSDLAELYEVPTGNLNRAVKRNNESFPEDFCFSLTKEEFKNLKCQNGIARSDEEVVRGGRRTPPIVFTEHGVAGLSSVLRSEKAVFINIEIMTLSLRCFFKRSW
jgi:hypothetical protein